MPKKKMYDSNIGTERTVFYRSNEQEYGPSSIWLEPLQLENSVITVNGEKVWLPVLNVQKYYPNAKCYAMIENLINYPITFVDILYSYDDILGKLENNYKFLEQFLIGFSRTRINSLSMISPALVVAPDDSKEAKKFADARNMAIRDAIYGDILCMENYKEDTIEVKNKTKENEKEKEEESFLLEFLRAFYNGASGKAVEKPKTKTEKASILKQTRMIKSGAMVIPRKSIGKYFTTYHVELKISEETKDAKESIGIFFENIDDLGLIGNDEMSQIRLKRFGDVIFDSMIIETFLKINIEKKPIWMFVGKYNESNARIEVDKRVERYFEKLNELIIPTRPSGSGR